jgi:hypothetical protein
VTRAIFTAAAVVLVLGTGSPQARTTANPVAVENALPGTTAWNTRNNDNSDVYGTQIGGVPGDEIDLHVSTSGRYRIVVYRLGWYGGTGGRMMACIPSCGGDEQGHVQTATDSPQAVPVRANWPVTDVLHTGTDWVSGYYIVEAVRTNGSGAGSAATTFFILRQPPDATQSQILVQVPVNTWEAYNDWGGHSLYNIISPATDKVSFERPFGGNAQTPLWNELQLVHFLEREGYDVSYQTDVDSDADPGSLQRHQLVMVSGHAEYWTLRQRIGFDDALVSGTNLAFMGANQAYWNVRYEDGGTTIFSEKSLYDPNPDPTQKTAMFREIGRPECLLEGVQHTNFTVYDHPLDYTVTDAGAADPWLAGTGLTAGSVIAGVVGREHDAFAPGCAPANTIVLFHYHGIVQPQDADAVRYTAPSGARVFSSGAYNLTLALDAYRSDDTLGRAFPVGADRTVPVDPRVQQFMRNALDDLTRPAPPLLVRKISDNGRLRIQTGWPDDPRITSRVVYRVRAEDGSRELVCSGHQHCFPAPPDQPGTYHVEVSYVDAWGGTSVPTSSTQWTKSQP